MADAKRDQNRVTTLLAASNADSLTPIILLADSITSRLLVDAIASLSPSTTAGWSTSKTDALSNTATAVKASAGTVGGYHIYNPNTSVAYVHFYNIAAASVTVGTSARQMTLAVPAFGALDGFGAVGLVFTTAISIAATTTVTGSTAPSTGLLTNIFYA